MLPSDCVVRALAYPPQEQYRESFWMKEYCLAPALAVAQHAHIQPTASQVLTGLKSARPAQQTCFALAKRGDKFGPLRCSIHIRLAHVTVSTSPISAVECYGRSIIVLR